MTIPNGYNFGAGRPSMADFPLSSRVTNARGQAWGLPQAHNAVNRESRAPAFKITARQSSLPIGNVEGALIGDSISHNYDRFLEQFNGQGQPVKYDFGKQLGFQFESIPSVFYYSILVNDEFVREEAHILAEFNYVPLNKGISLTTNTEEMLSSPYDESSTAKEWRRNSESRHWRTWVATCIMLETLMGDEIKEEGDNVNSSSQTHGRQYDTYSFEAGEETIERNDLMSSGINWDSDAPFITKMSRLRDNHSSVNFDDQTLETLNPQLDAKVIPFVRNLVRTYSTMYLADEIFLKSVAGYPYYSPGRHVYEVDTDVFKNAHSETLTQIMSAIKDYDLKNWVATHALNGRKFTRTPRAANQMDQIYRDVYDKKIISLQTRCWPNNVLDANETVKFSLALGGERRREFKLAHDNRKNFIRNTTSSLRHIWSYLKKMTFDAGRVRESSVRGGTERAHLMNAVSNNPRSVTVDDGGLHPLSEGSSYSRAMHIRRIIFNAYADMKTGVKYNISSISSTDESLSIPVGNLGNYHVDDIQKIVAPELQIQVTDGGESGQEFSKTRVVFCPYLLDDSYFQYGDSETRVITARDLLKLKKKYLEKLISEYPFDADDWSDQVSYSNSPGIEDPASAPLEMWLTKYGPQHFFNLLENFIIRLCPAKREENPSGASNIELSQISAANEYKFDLARGCILLTPENIVAHIGKRKIGKFLFDLSLNYEFYANLYDLDRNPDTGVFGGADYAPGQTVGDFQPNYAIKIYDNHLGMAARTEEQIVNEFTSNHNDQDPSIFSVSQTLEAYTTMVQPTLSFAVGGSFPPEILSLVNSSIIKATAPANEELLGWHRKTYVFFCIIMQITTDIASELVNGKMPYFSRQFRSNDGSMGGGENQPKIHKNVDMADKLFSVFIRKNRARFSGDPYLLVPNTLYPNAPSLTGLITGEINISDLNFGQLLDIINHHREALVAPTVDSITASMFESMENWQQAHGGLPNAMRDQVESYDQVMEQALHAITGTYSDVHLRNNQDEALRNIERFFASGTRGDFNYHEVFRNYINRKKTMGLGDNTRDQVRRDNYTALMTSEIGMSEQMTLVADSGENVSVRMATQVYGVGAGGLPVAMGFLGVDITSEIKEKIIDNFKNKLLNLDRNTNILVLFSEFICGQLFYGIDSSADDISISERDQRTTDEAFEKNWGLSDYEENTKGILNYIFKEFISSASNEPDNAERAPHFMHFPVLSSHDLYTVIEQYIEICDSYCINLPNVQLKFENTINDRFNSGAGSVQYAETAQEAIVASSGQSPSDLVNFTPNSANALTPLAAISRSHAGNLHNANRSVLQQAVDDLNLYMNRANDYFRIASKILSVEPTFRLKIIPALGSSNSEEPGAANEAPQTPTMSEFSRINSVGFLPHISLSTPYFRKWMITNEMKLARNEEIFNIETSIDGEHKVIDDVYPGLNLYSKVGIEKKFKSHRTTNDVPRRHPPYENPLHLSHASIPKHLNFTEIHDDLREQIRNLTSLFSDPAASSRGSIEYPNLNSGLRDVSVKFYKNNIGHRPNPRSPFNYSEISTFYGYPVNAFKSVGNLQGPQSLHETNRPNNQLLMNIQSNWHARTQAPPPATSDGAQAAPPLNVVANRTKIVKSLTSQPSISDEYAEFLAENVFEDYLNILPAAWYANLYRKFPPIVAVESKKDEILKYSNPISNNGFPVDNEFSSDYDRVLAECSNDTIKGTIVNRRQRTTTFRFIEFNYRLRKVKYKFHRAFGWNAAEGTANNHIPDIFRSNIVSSADSDMPGGLIERYVRPNEPGNRGLLGSVELSSSNQYDGASPEIYWSPLWSKMGDNYSSPNRPNGTDQSLRDVDLRSVNSGDIVNLKVRAKNFPYQMSKLSNLFQYMEKYQPTSTNQHSIGVKQFAELHYDLLFNGGKFSAYQVPTIDAFYQKNGKNFHRIMDPSFAFQSPPSWDTGLTKLRDDTSRSNEAQFNAANSHLLSRVSSCWGSNSNPLSHISYLGTAGSRNWLIATALAQTPATLLEWLRPTHRRGPTQDLGPPENETEQFKAHNSSQTTAAFRNEVSRVYREYGGQYNHDFFPNDARRYDDWQLLKAGVDDGFIFNCFDQKTNALEEDGRPIALTFEPEGNPGENYNDKILQKNSTKFEYYYAKAKMLWLQNHDPIYSEYGSTGKYASIPDCAKFIPTNNGSQATFTNGFNSDYKFYDHYLGQSSKDLFINGFAYAAPYSAKCPWAPAFDSEYRNKSYHSSETDQSNNHIGYQGYAKEKCVAKFGGSAQWASHFYNPYIQDPQQSSTVLGMFDLPDFSDSTTDGDSPLINRTSTYSQAFAEFQAEGSDAMANNAKRVLNGDRFKVAYERVNYVEQLQPIYNWTDFDWSNVGGVVEKSNASKYYALYWDSHEVMQQSNHRTNSPPGRDANSQYISYENQADINVARMFNYAPTPHIDIQHGDPTKPYDPVWKKPGDVWWTCFTENTNMFSADNDLHSMHAPTSLYAKKYDLIDFLKPEKYNRIKVGSSLPDIPYENQERRSFSDSSDLRFRHPPLYSPTNRYEILDNPSVAQTIGDREDFGNPLLDPKQDLMFYYHHGDDNTTNYERLYYKYKEAPITNARSMFMTMNDTITEDNPYLYGDVDFCKFRVGHRGEELPNRNPYISRVPKISYQQFWPKNDPDWAQFESVVPEFELYNRSKDFTHPGEGLIKTRHDYDAGNIRTLKDTYHTKKIYLSKDENGQHAFWSTEKVPEEFDEVPSSLRFRLNSLAKLKDYTVSVPLKSNLARWYKVMDGNDIDLNTPFDNFYIRSKNTGAITSPQFNGFTPIVSYIGQSNSGQFKGRPHSWAGRQVPVPTTAEGNRSPAAGFEANYTISDSFEAPVGKYIYDLLQANDDLFEPDSQRKYFVDPREPNAYVPFSANPNDSSPWSNHANHWNFSTDVDSRMDSKRFADASLPMHHIRAKYPRLGQVRFHEHEVHGVSYSKFHIDMSKRVEAHNKVNKENAITFFKEIKDSVARYQAYAWKVIGGGNSIQFQPRFAKNSNLDAKNNNQPVSQNYLMYDDTSRLNQQNSQGVVQAQAIGYRSSMNWVGGEWRGSWSQADSQNWTFKDVESGFSGASESHQVNYAGLIQSDSPSNMRSSRFHTYNITYQTEDAARSVSLPAPFLPNREKISSDLPVMKTSFYPYNTFAKYFVPINSQGTFGEFVDYGFTTDAPQGGSLGQGFLINGDFTKQDPLLVSIDERDFFFNATTDRTTPISDFSERNLAGLSGRDYNDARTERAILTKIPCIQSWDEEHPIVEFDIRLGSTQDTLPPDIYYDLDYTTIANLNSGLKPAQRYGGYANSFEKLSVASNTILAHEKLEDHYLQHLLGYQKYICKFEAAYILNSKYYCELLQNVTWDVTNTVRSLEPDSAIAAGFGAIGSNQASADSPGNIARAALAPMFKNLGFSNMTPSVLSNWATMGELLSKQRFDPDASIIYAGGDEGNELNLPDVGLPALTKVSAYSFDSIHDPRWDHSALTMFKKLERHIFADSKLNSKSRVAFAGILSGQLSKLYDSSYNLTRDKHETDDIHDIGIFNNPILPYVNLEIELIDNFRPWIIFSKLKKSFVLNNAAYGNLSKFGYNANQNGENEAPWSAFEECFTNVNYPNILKDTTESFMFGETVGIPSGVIQDDALFNIADDDDTLGVQKLDDYFIDVSDARIAPRFGNFDDAKKNSLLDLYLKIYANKVLGLEMNHVLIPDSKIEDFVPHTNTDATFGERDYTELLKFNCKLLIENLSKTAGDNSQVISRRRKFMKYFFQRQEIPMLRTTDGEREYQEFDPITSRNEVFPTRMSNYSIFERDAHNLTLNQMGEVLTGENTPIINDDQIYRTHRDVDSAPVSDLQRARALSDINYLFEILSPGSLGNDAYLHLKKLQPFKFKEPITENSLRAAEILTSVNESYRTISDFAIDYRCGFKFDYIVGTSYSLSEFKIAGFRSTLDGVSLNTNNVPPGLSTYLNDHTFKGDTPFNFAPDNQEYISRYIINNVPYLEIVDSNEEKHIKVIENSIQPLSIRMKFVK